VRCVVHAGMPKTGSTALQHFLHHNRHTLAEANIFLPPYPDGISHRVLVALAFPRKKLRRSWLAFSQRSGRSRSLIAIQANALYSAVSFRRTIRRRQPETTVLTAEQFLGFHRRYLETFARRLRLDAFASLEFILYVREPTEWVASKALEQLKVGALGFPTGFFSPLNAVKRFADDVESLFDAQVRLRKYDREALDGGDVREDFVTEFLPTINPGQLDYPLLVKNLSISPEGACLLAAYREEHHPGLPPKVVPAEVRALLSSILEIEERFPRPKPRLLPEIDAIIRQQASKTLSWMADRHGIRFDSSSPQPRSSEGPHGLATEIDTRVLGGTAVERINRIFDMDHGYAGWLRQTLSRASLPIEKS
jgi:hypothetical protein